MQKLAFLSNNKILLGIILLSLFLRLFLISYPQAYVFDEVYHGFTAVEYVKGNRDAWSPWGKPPPGVAYEWTHPPLAKELMALSLYTFNTQDNWGWRIPGVILGTLSVLLVYLIGQKLFSLKIVSLLAAGFFSIDGLNFVQSRTGMNDSYLVFFALVSLLLLLNKKIFLSSIFFGLAISSKWAGIYMLAPIILVLFWQKQLFKIIYFFTIPALVYMACYIPYFWQGYSYQDFLTLQQQMFNYHTKLVATHDYASPWWSWPLNIYPVWYYVNYSNGLTGNIFASGNPMLFLFGFLAMIYTLIESLAIRSKNLFLVAFCYLVFILPWSISPRIMFLYHYSPCVPFLCLALGFQLAKLRTNYQGVFYFLIGMIIFGFLFVYPILVGIPIPQEYLRLFFATNSTKNPFGSL